MVVFVVECIVSCGCCMESVFFFQAEDGIRDLVRSRGLGDVYKRQDSPFYTGEQMKPYYNQKDPAKAKALLKEAGYKGAVSYTHLTLPTSDLV